MSTVAEPRPAADQPRTKVGTLTVVGSGIKSVAHFTMEARARIEWADKVLHCVADGVTDAYIRDLNPNSEDLHVYYGEGKRRRRTYEEMSGRMVEFVRRGDNVVVVMYGHPGVFVHPTYHAMDQLSEEGYRVEMLPGISAEDCMFADLHIDPAREGLQTYEATGFLVRKRVFDPAVPLVIWQIGCVGEGGFSRHGFDGGNVRVLCEVLAEVYGEDHEVVIYEAAQHPLATPRIRTYRLPEIGPEDVTGISTMFVPPLHQAPVDREMVQRLGMG